MWFQTWHYRRPKMKNVSFTELFQLFPWVEAGQHAPRTHARAHTLTQTRVCIIAGMYAGVYVCCRMKHCGHVAVTLISDGTMPPSMTCYVLHDDWQFIGKPCWNSTGTISFLFSSVFPFLAFPYPLRVFISLSHLSIKTAKVTSLTFRCTVWNVELHVWLLRRQTDTTYIDNIRTCEVNMLCVGRKNLKMSWTYVQSTNTNDRYRHSFCRFCALLVHSII